MDPSSKGFRNPYLWVVDLQNKTLKRRGPENVASIVGFYDWEKLGNEAPSIEALYSQIESRAALVITNVRACNFQLSLEDRYNLSNFLGLQLTRVPRFREVTADTQVVRAQNWLQDFAQDEERMRAKLQDYNESRGDAGSMLTIESVRDSIEKKRFTLKPELDYVLGMTLNVGLEFARIIFGMNWSFVIATEGASFFTSDSPVALLTPDAKPRRIDFKNGRNPELEISFPISPSCSLLLHQHEVSESVVSIGAEQINEVNRRTFPVVARYVFCSSEQLGKWALKQ